MVLRQFTLCLLTTLTVFGCAVEAFIQPLNTRRHLGVLARETACCSRGEHGCRTVLCSPPVLRRVRHPAHASLARVHLQAKIQIATKEVEKLESKVRALKTELAAVWTKGSRTRQRVLAQAGERLEIDGTPGQILQQHQPHSARPTTVWPKCGSSSVAPAHEYMKARALRLCRLMFTSMLVCMARPMLAVAAASASTALPQEYSYTGAKKLLVGLCAMLLGAIPLGLPASALLVAGASLSEIATPIRAGMILAAVPFAAARFVPRVKRLRFNLESFLQSDFFKIFDLWRLLESALGGSRRKGVAGEDEVMPRMTAEREAALPAANPVWVSINKELWEAKETIAMQEQTISELRASLTRQQLVVDDLRRRNAELQGLASDNAEQ